MNTIHSLKNKFYSSVIIATLLGILIFFLSNYNIINSSIVTFLSTIDAAFFAFSIGIYIYWKERNDFYESLKTGLIKYLEYIINDLPKSNKATNELSVGYLNTSYINQVISSGFFNEILPNLILFQGKIEYYVLFSQECITKQHDDNNPLKSWHKTNLNNSYEVLVEDAKGILKHLSAT